jgi:hypothetical protein
MMVELLGVIEKKKTTEYAKLVRNTITRVIQRPDELTEILGYYAQSNLRSGMKTLQKLPNGLKRGISEAFHKFNEYQFQKYNKDSVIKLRDVMFLCHPKPQSEVEASLYKRLANNELETPKTWEVKISEAGADKSKKKAAWEDLISSNSLGMMALIRNLRNIIEADVSRDHIAMVVKQLTNENAVLKSKQLPFRFFSAYNELTNMTSYDVFMVKEIKTVLETAVKISVQNLEGFDSTTRVLIANDTSGSMSFALSEKSSIKYVDVGLLMGQLLQSRCKNVVTGCFGDSWKVYDVPKDNVLANTLNLRRISGFYN